MNRIVKYFEDNPEEIPSTERFYFMSQYNSVLKIENELASPDFHTNVYLRSDDENHYKLFNSDFKDNTFDVGEDENNKNQLQFDLSGVSKHMNKFDGYVYKILKELNMAKGGIANQSGTTNQPQSNTGSSTPPSVSSNPSTKVNQPMTTGTNKSLGQNNTSGQQYNPDEMDSMILDKGTDFNNLLQDPDTSTAVFQHISSSLADPNYKNRVSLQNTLKNNQTFNKAYSDYIRQYKPLNTP
jgi:hypothetical protein